MVPDRLQVLSGIDQFRTDAVRAEKLADGVGNAILAMSARIPGASCRAMYAIAGSVYRDRG